MKGIGKMRCRKGMELRPGQMEASIKGSIGVGKNTVLGNIRGMTVQYILDSGLIIRLTEEVYISG